MNIRWQDLILAVAGYNKTGVLGTSFDGKSIKPLTALGYDDCGIYLMIPQFLKILNLGEQGISIFFYVIFFVGYFLGSIGLFFFYEKWTQRLSGLLWLTMLAYFSMNIGDVYITYFSSIAGIIPVFLLLMRKKKIFDTAPFYSFFFFSGFYLNFLNYIRSSSGMGSLVFIISTVFLNKEIPNKQKKKCLFFLFIGYCSIVCYFNLLKYETQKYFKQNYNQEIVINNHPFWHTLYLSFGFLKFKNNDHIIWDDNYALIRAREIDPEVNYCNKHYDALLKNEFLKLIFHQFDFVLTTLFAKLGVIIYFILISANFGLVLSLYFKTQYQFSIPFFVAIMFYSIFPLIALPTNAYLLGLITISGLYGLYCINQFNKFVSLVLFLLINAWISGFICLCRNAMLNFI